MKPSQDGKNKLDGLIAKGGGLELDPLSLQEIQEVRSRILAGIAAELRETAKYGDFVIRDRKSDGIYWTLTVEVPKNNHLGLDESLEGASAWWAGPPTGAADVLSIVAEKQQINLRFATSQPPEQGKLLRIYPPQYLEALFDCWKDIQLATIALGCARAIEYRNESVGVSTQVHDEHKWLRSGQRRAFDLTKWNAGFLWGPPGTGKTTTLGALLASYLVQNPSAKVLLMSTTNNATDLALVSVDRAMASLKYASEDARKARRKCFRLGSHFRAHHYEGREHLIPVKDPVLIKELIKVEAVRPRPEDVQAYGAWRSKMEALQEKIRTQAADVLRNSRLAAMTTTLGIFWFQRISQLDFDLIIFDEASQIAKAYALLLAPLAKCVCFAGDPKQLSPIVQADHSDAKEWLGASMFTYMDKTSESVCFLDEQSRMAEPICTLVSNVFYDGKLKVASDCINNPKWQGERRLRQFNSGREGNTRIINILSNGTFSQKYGGFIRYESAKKTKDIVRELALVTDEKDVVVVTPFRAQRTLIRTFLRNERLSNVDVLTVHRAQGGERHTVIFDPVVGNSDFLKGDEAKRLVNVGISRAKARLILLISPEDRKNPIFCGLASVIENAQRFESAIDIRTLVNDRDYPKCLLGKVVKMNSVVGVVEAADSAEFQLRCFTSGGLKTFLTARIKQKYS